MRLQPEEALGISIHDWVLWNTKLPFIHIGNERKCSWDYGKKLKRMGVLPGVSDIFMPRANKTYHGLWIELKIKPNKPTENQIKFLNQMLSEGYDACVCYTFDETISVIKRFYEL
jgi:hypothetical protein